MGAGGVKPVPAPPRVLQASAAHCPHRPAGSTPCGFMIGMPIKAPGCQDQVARLEVLLQPVFQALFVRTDRAVGDAEMKRGSRPDTEFAQRCGKLGASRRAQAFWRPPVLVRIARFAIGHGDDAYLHALLRSVTEQSTTAEDLVVWMGCDHHDAIMAGAEGIGRCCRPL